MGRWHYSIALTLVLLLVGMTAPLALAEDEDPAPQTTTTTTTTTTTVSEPTTTVPSPGAKNKLPDAESPPPDDGDPGDGEGLDPPVIVKTPPVKVKRYDVLKKLVFPVVGPSYFHASFGACRDACTREHHGNDIMTWYWKGQPVVAATDGVITKITYDEGNAGCSVRIKDPNRWETRYYHLNNDFPGTDDIGYPCGVPGLREGSQVTAGQIIGYVGDSGNAENTPAHLHFELRMPNGYPVDPYKSLKKAERIAYEWLPNDISLATRMITASVKPGSAPTTVVITSQEAHLLTGSESDSMWLDAPVVAVDLSDPVPGNEEIRRIGSRSVVIISNLDVRWLQDVIAANAMIVDVIPLPKFKEQTVHYIPDSTEVPVIGPNPVDRFATLISGNPELLWRSWKGTFNTFTVNHRSLVFASALRGTPNIGHRSAAAPGKYFDRQLVWWATGSGWVGTMPDADPPDRGYAYVTERQANPGTLVFLGSLAEIPPMPIWKSK